MASKKIKKLGKVAALLGAAYAASKMGSDNTMDGTEMDGTEGVFSSSKSTKPSMLDKIKKGVKDYATKDYVIKSPDRNPNMATKDTANFSFLGGAKTGTFVTAKTKMGKNKKTRIC